jgi:hypothetical protein
LIIPGAACVDAQLDITSFILNIAADLIGEQLFPSLKTHWTTKDRWPEGVIIPEHGSIS